jgi:hypothetical protein
LCWIGITNPLNHIRPAIWSWEIIRKKNKKRHVSKLMNKNIKEVSTMKKRTKHNRLEREKK